VSPQKLAEVVALHDPLELAPRDIDPREWERYRENVAEIFDAFGMPLDTPGTVETPERFLRALFDATAGYDGDAKLLTAFPSESRETSDAAPAQIIEGPIAFSALCEHHALPFTGHVRLFARRFTVQERMGEQIADTLVHLIEPRGVAVHLEASHLCTQMRGVEEASRTTTTFWRGAFDDSELRREFLDEIRHRRV
jgi:GTP cyclohydrolase I